MPAKASALRRILTDLDVVEVLRLWPECFPQFPRPTSKGEALATLHLARTQAESIPLALRRYSHQWLTERGLPSHLPDALRPPIVARAVGIMVSARDPEVAAAIRGAMSAAVAGAYADGRTEPGFVRARMEEARTRERRALGLPPLN